MNLAMPSTAARVAVNIRFFQRSGLDRTSAITIGALDSIAGFVAQIGLILTILAFGLGSLDLQLDEKFSYEASGDLLLVIAIVLVIAIATALLVPRLRHAVTSWIHHAWTKVWPLLDSPRRLVSVLGANVVVELLFSWCSYTVLRSFGQDVAFVDVTLVNEGVARFAGLIPVPGGWA